MTRPSKENLMADFGSFSDLAGITANTVERPKQLPTAQYVAVITGPMKEVRSKPPKNTLGAEFPVKLQACLDESVAQNIAQDEKLQKALSKDYTITFWITADSLWRLTAFGTAMGLSDTLSITEMLEALAGLGTPFMVQGKLNPPQDGQEGDGFFRLDNPAPLPA